MMEGTEKKNHDWVTCGSDLFDGELALRAEAAFVFLSEETKERLFQQDGGNGEKKYDWVNCGKELQSTPDNSNRQGKPKKVGVIGSSKKIAGSKEKKAVFTGQ